MDASFFAAVLEVQGGPLEVTAEGRTMLNIGVCQSCIKGQ
jgi:hypothetical protein